MKKKYLSKETCTMIRGVAAFIILLHHLSSYISFGKPLDFVFKNIGALMATVFFFYSGYGLMYNLTHKEGYMNSFVNKRLLSVIIPYVIANIFYVSYQLLTGTFQGFSYYLSEIKKGYTLVPYSWYVLVIIILYCIFYISFRWLTAERGLLLCLVLNIGYMLFINAIGFGEWWYNTCFAFFFGIVFSMYYSNADSFLQKKPILKFICFSLLFLILLVSGKLFSQVYVLMLIKSLRSVVFCVCILYISMILQKRNKVLMILGDLSFEIYLYQGFAISVCWEFFRTNTILFICTVLIITLVTAYIMHNVNNKILTH